MPVAPRVQEYFSCARTRECSALRIFGAASSDRQTRAGKNNLSWRPFGFFALRRLSAFRTPGNNLGVETKRCVNDGAFSLAWEYGTTETVLTSSDDATKKPRIVCSASAKLRPEFARVAGAGRKWDRHELIGVRGQLTSVRNDLVVAGERRWAAWARRRGARVKLPNPSRQGPLRQPISHAYLPCP